MIKLVSLCLLLGSLSAGQDRITLADGTRLHGRVLGLYQDGLTVLPSGEDVPRRLRWDELESSGLEVGAELPVTLSNGDRITGRPSLQDGNRLRVVNELLPEVLVPLTSLTRAPPAPVGEAPSDDVPAPAAESEAAADRDTILETEDWSGSAALLGTLRTGNVDSALAVFNVGLTRQWARDRFNAEAAFAFGETDGESTARNARGRGKWDHFYDPDFYSYALAEAEWDEIKDLDLRALLGIGVGLNAWRGEGDHRSLDFEFGVTGIYESFSTSDDDAAWQLAGRAAVSYLDEWGEGMLFTQRLEILVPVGEYADYIARSYTALEMPLADAWSLKNILEIEYQGDPPSDSENLDLKLLVGVEYTF